MFDFSSRRNSSGAFDGSCRLKRIYYQRGNNKLSYHVCTSAQTKSGRSNAFIREAEIRNLNPLCCSLEKYLWDVKKEIDDFQDKYEKLAVFRTLEGLMSLCDIL